MKTEPESSAAPAKLERGSQSQASKRSRRKRPSRIWESESPPPSPPLPVSSHSIDTTRFTRYSGDTVRALRAVPDDETILLLTPVVPHPAAVELCDRDGDPFEPFGRALSRYHKRIRHVPYVPGSPLSEIHLAFVRKASAVIVVWCEPTSALQRPTQISEQPQNAPAKLFAGQMQFIEDVRTALNQSEEFASKVQASPLIVASTGPRGCLLDHGIGLDDFDTVTYSAYQTRALEDVATMLYEAPLSPL